MKKLAHRAFYLMVVAGAAALSGCGGGSTGTDPGGSSPSQTYTIGGSVTGLAPGQSVVLLDDGGDTLTVSTNGPFTFATALASGSSYAVTVGTQPTGHTCSVSQSSGTIGAQRVTNVSVTCTINVYTVGGTIAGLGNAAGLVLVNGKDTLAVPSGATKFTMPTAVAYQSSYDVILQTHPPALDCIITGGAGSVAAENVTGISISCAAGKVSVLYSFYGGPTDAGGPYGSLIQASDGDLYGMTLGGGANDAGAVFKINPAGTETLLHSFDGTDGQNPFGNLVQASDGNFYGMTETGTGNAGTIFKMTPSGTVTVLHSFSGGADGANPYGTLIQARDGNFYGVTSYGGAGAAGTVFEITPAGTETILHSFTGQPTDGGAPYGSLVQGSDGNLYGMTLVGGANNDGTVFKISAGTESLLHSFAGGTTDGATPYGSLIQGQDGNFYGMTESGGTYGSGTLFRITPGGTETVLYSFAGGTADGANPEGSLIQANDGNFYGMTQGGGAQNAGTLFEITPAGAETVLYSFPGAYAGEANTYGNLIQTTNGDLYGLANFGTYTYGEVFMLN
jgi:uncharacterized repeat protein (TIGR03803 family)